MLVIRTVRKKASFSRKDELELLLWQSLEIDSRGDLPHWKTFLIVLFSSITLSEALIVSFLDWQFEEILEAEIDLNYQDLKHRKHVPLNSPSPWRKRWRRHRRSSQDKNLKARYHPLCQLLETLKYINLGIMLKTLLFVVSKRHLVMVTISNYHECGIIASYRANSCMLLLDWIGSVSDRLKWVSIA